MNLRKRKHHRVSFHYWGWTARPFPLCLTVPGEPFLLTSLFIERDYRKVASHLPTNFPLNLTYTLRTHSTDLTASSKSY